MKLVWDEIGKRTYETGVDHGVLYLQENGKYPKGVAWSGLTSISENPSGAEDTPLYADNMKYLNLKSAEELGITIECYTYPDEWKKCDGTAELAPGVNLGQQRRVSFGLSYRTRIGNDTENADFGYKLHLIYGCSASPSTETFETINDSPSANTFSYEISTTPVPVDGFKPVASVEIDSTTVDPEALVKLEQILYGTEENEARLPLPDELKTIFEVAG